MSAFTHRSVLKSIAAAEREMEKVMGETLEFKSERDLERKVWALWDLVNEKVDLEEKLESDPHRTLYSLLPTSPLISPSPSTSSMSIKGKPWFVLSPMCKSAPYVGEKPRNMMRIITL